MGRSQALAYANAAREDLVAATRTLDLLLEHGADNNVVHGGPIDTGMPPLEVAIEGFCTQITMWRVRDLDAVVS